MATRFFSFTLPATTNYYSLWDRINLITGFVPANSFIPDRGYELNLSSDSGALKVSDSNNANAAGMPMASGVNKTWRSDRNDICLKEFFVSGSGLLVSGSFSWH